MADTVQVKFSRGTLANYNSLATKDAGTLYFITDVGEEAIYLNGQKYTFNETKTKALIDALGTENDVVVASVADGVVTLKTSLFETKGIIDARTNTITFAKVATTGAAADVSVADTNGNYEGATVEAVLAEIATKIGNGVDGKTIYLKDESAGQTAYAKVYKLYQGADATDMTKNTLIGEIDTPLDKVLKAATLVEQDDQGHTGTYLKLEFQNDAGVIYVDLAKLVDAYQGVEGAEIKVVVNGYNISAEIVEISSGKIIYKTETDSETGTVTKTTVTAALNDLYSKISDATTLITTKINELDATVSIVDTANENPLNITIVEEDGKLTSVTGSIDANTFDAYGAASRVQGSTTKTVKDMEDLVGEIPETSEATTVIDYVDEKTGAGVSALNGNATIATNTDGVVTIKGGVEESAGIIDNDDDAADITLAKVATTGAAVDVKYGASSNVNAEIAKIEGDATTEGSIAKAKADVIGASTDAATADTVNGAKAYADSKMTEALTWGVIGA